MNPYIIATVVGRIMGLKRDCPACKRSQVVPPSMKHETVRCKFCGTDIPPKQTTR